MSEDNTTAPNAVIFQAPQPAPETPAKRAPRRASAPAGPPSAADKPAQAAKSTAAAKKDKPASGAGSKAKTKAKADSDDAVAAGEAKRKRTRAKKDPAASSDGEQPKDQDSSPKDAANKGPEASDNDSDGDDAAKRRRRRGGRGRGKKRADGDGDDGDGGSSQRDDSTSGDSGSGDDSSSDDGDGSGTSRRRRRRSRGSRSSSSSSSSNNDDQLQGSTRLQAKRQRRRDSRDGQRRRPVISEAEFLARRESVKRDMVVREKDGRVQIAVLEDDVLVEHYVSHQADSSMAGNVYLGRVQNVLPGMEAAFVDVGRGRNAVLYAGEVNWDAAGLDGKPKRIELALKPGDTVMVQVTKDPIGHKGARVTSQISLAGRFLVYVPAGGVTGISRKLPDTERNRLKKLLREVIPADAGVIVRTAAEGASEEELRADVERLKRQWESIEVEAKGGKAPQLLRGEPDMAIRVVRDIFNEDFESLTIQGEDTWNSLSAYVGQVATDLAPRLHKFVGEGDVFTAHRIDEQLTKGMDRKVWLPSGGSLVIDRTEAMTVVDVNTGKFVGKGGTLEETMTLNNLEAAEEIVRQLRLRDIGGIIVIDFVDMLLEANRDRVLRRLIECLSRDRTKHQVAEVTSLGLVQMTRKRVGQGLVEAFSETCDHCKGRGFLVQGEPVGEATEKQPEQPRRRGSRSTAGKAKAEEPKPAADVPALDQRDESREIVKATLASIAAAAEKAHHANEGEPAHADSTEATEEQPATEQPATEQPATEQPATPEPADEDASQ
ncbi:Rne/Rng family ribonuclease [Demequina sp.]|uniref:Rne/Rng family ribonuclease n=1 Tax=Demequina sp. TaxID=2050685 RepID=UPI00344EE37F